MAIYTPYTNNATTPDANIIYPSASAIAARDALYAARANRVTAQPQPYYNPSQQNTSKAYTDYNSNAQLLKDMNTSLQGQLTAQTNLYNQQAADKAAKIRQAIAMQTQQGEATKADYTNQMNTAIGTLNSERAKLPGQTTTLNNTASLQGMNNEQNIRNSLAQMGLLQSGESGSQQLLNDVSTANRINANNLQGQQLDTNYGNQIASSQTDLASKVKAINDAIAIAQANGDENSLAALTNAQNQIALSTAQNNTTMNNLQYQNSRNATADNQWQQSFDQQKAQNEATNALNEGQLTGYYGGIHYVNGVPQTATSSNDTYATGADYEFARKINPNGNVQLYTPGQTQMGVGDTFLGGTAVLGNDRLNGATRVFGSAAQDTANEYTKYLAQQNSQPVQVNQQTSSSSITLPPAIASQYPGATNVIKTDNGYRFNTSNGGLVYYVG